jgi:hypothetical protein
VLLESYSYIKLDDDSELEEWKREIGWLAGQPIRYKNDLKRESERRGIFFSLTFFLICGFRRKTHQHTAICNGTEMRTRSQNDFVTMESVGVPMQSSCFAGFLFFWKEILRKHWSIRKHSIRIMKY